MALYAIGDPHLSLGCDKPMDAFGGAWEGYVDKLRAGFAGLTAEDTVVFCGDLSWGMSLEEALPDFQFLEDLFPGKKILVKGNHDYWWTTANKMLTFWAGQGLNNFSLLHNNCQLYGEVALCGTRGWFFEEEADGHNEKVFKRELLRLETSLQAAGERELPGFRLLLWTSPWWKSPAGAGRGAGKCGIPPDRRRLSPFLPPKGTAGGGMRKSSGKSGKKTGKMKLSLIQ